MQLRWLLTAAIISLVLGVPKSGTLGPQSTRTLQQEAQRISPVANMDIHERLSRVRANAPMGLHTIGTNCDNNYSTSNTIQGDPHSPTQPRGGQASSTLAEPLMRTSVPAEAQGAPSTAIQRASAKEPKDAVWSTLIALRAIGTNCDNNWAGLATAFL